MRPLAFILLIALSGFAAGQKKNQENDPDLQQLMREAKAKSITRSKSGIHKAEHPLKVYAFTPAQENDIGVDFQTWLAAWNKADGGTYGQLEEAADASQADIILARFASPLKLARESLSSDVNSTVQPSVDPVSHAPMPITRVSSVYSVAKVYSYIIAREPDGLKILWSSEDSVRVAGAHEGNYVDLSDSKDSKRINAKLRDKFFGMIRAGARTVSQ
jgi:hypothetical protein